MSRPVDATAVSDALLDAAGGLIPRGLGRSYGDAAQCSGGLTLDMTGLNHIGILDTTTGSIDVAGGVSLHELLQSIIPAGWFVPVTPGTRYVTVGGAIAADVHGKNHHRDGSFARHVIEMRLVTPSGVIDVSPEREPDLFWGTTGGMGLTGIVVSARLRLMPIATSWMQVDSQRFTTLTDLMSTMEATDSTYRYSVAWLDCTRGGNGRFRSVLTRGDHAPTGAIPGRLWGRSRESPGDPSLRVQRSTPRRLVGQTSIRALNEVWFRSSPNAEKQLVSLGNFFHPLDRVAGWNRLYGPGGFVQYQFAVNPERRDVVEHAVDAIVSSGCPSSLAVLKRFGPGTPGPLSFSQEGWTLALDFPLTSSNLSRLLDRLDHAVANAAGRIYLAKDSRLRPELLARMYPRIDEMAGICASVDPKGVLASDLSRRLGITP